MAYPPLIQGKTAAEYRIHFESMYCRHPIVTFDGISVRFRKRNFNHCFFESTQRDRDKNELSVARCERIDWIKAALEDSRALLVYSWNRDTRDYDTDRRTALVETNYAVVIRMTGPKEAEFLTAFVASDVPEGNHILSTVDKIRVSPKWQ